MGELVACVDVDGVLLEYDGWKGIHNFGKPIDGAADFLKRLKEMGYKIILFTVRCNVVLNGHEVPASEANNSPLSALAYLEGLVRDYFQKHDLVYDAVYTGQGKPLADVYIDDRAISCRPLDSCRSEEGGPSPVCRAFYNATLNNVEWLRKREETVK